MAKMWIRSPDAGGVKIPVVAQERTRQRILAYAEQHYAGKYIRLDIRFKGQFCYIDAYQEPDVAPGYQPSWFEGTREQYLEEMRNTPVHLCRLRYFGDEHAWGWSFYTYSNERYELSVFDNGSFYGEPEEAFQHAADMYLAGGK